MREYDTHPEAHKRGWKEDKGTENGEYQNLCATCDHYFVGNKHRVTCKLCSDSFADMTVEVKDDIEEFDLLKHKQVGLEQTYASIKIIIDFALDYKSDVDVSRIIKQLIKDFE